jgi:hypothetical protein
MNWVLAIFGVVALLIATGCMWYRRNEGQQRALMAATPTSKAAAVASLAPGTVVEAKGTLRCVAPLTAEFSQQPCVYFKAQIEREETYYTRDSSGKEERRTRTIPVHSNIQFAGCAVVDDSGQVALRLDGAEIEGQLVVNRRESESQGLAMSVINLASGRNQRAALITTETILAPDIAVYVLGEVQADRSIGQPVSGSKNKVFVVSQKSEEQRDKDLGRSMVWLLAVSVILAALGVGLLAWAAYESRKLASFSPNLIQLSVGRPAAFQASMPPARWAL